MTVSRKIYFPDAEKKFQQVKLHKFTQMKKNICWYFTDSHVLCAKHRPHGFASIKPFKPS